MFQIDIANECTVWRGITIVSCYYIFSFLKEKTYMKIGRRCLLTELGIICIRFSYSQMNKDDVLFGLCPLDRKSTRLNSSHVSIPYAVFCFKIKISPSIQRLVQQQ